MISKTNKSYFRAAAAVASMSDFHRHQLGCVVVDKHRIISSGFNSVKCHPLQAQLDSEKYGRECPGHIHAEIAALIPLMRDGADLSGASIYVYRQHKDKSLALARPCSNCEKIIKLMGIKKMFYTVENGYACEKLQN